MAWLWQFPPERLCDSIENHMWQKGSLGVHLYQKYPKSVKKWLSYGYIPTERLSDSIENPMGQKGILGCSFVPKRSIIHQEMAKLWLFSTWEVAWFHWEPHGKKGYPLVFVCTKEIQKRSKNDWVMAFFTLRGCVIPWKITWDQRGSLGFDLYQKDQKSVKKWLSYGSYGLSCRSQ